MGAKWSSGPIRWSNARETVLPAVQVAESRDNVSQTDGEPLPTVAHDATGDPGNHLAALEQAITDAGVVVTRLADLGGAHG